MKKSTHILFWVIFTLVIGLSNCEPTIWTVFLSICCGFTMGDVSHLLNQLV